MKILTIHSDFLEYEPKKKAFGGAEEITDLKKQRIDECLVVFTTVEKGDTPKIVQKYVDEIKNIAEKIKPKAIVLYPYAHLSSNLAGAKESKQILKSAEKVLSKDYKTYTSPFGWYKSFTISCKGHPLSELSREIKL